MTWITGNTKKVAEGYLEDLDKKMQWHEMDGFEVDFNIIYLDDLADMEVEVYIDELLVGLARHFDDIDKIVDAYWDERADS